MITRVRKGLFPLGAAIAMSLVLLGLVACGEADEPATSAPAPTAEPSTAPAETPDDSSTSTETEKTEPQGDLAPKFTLPSATGDSVRLDAYAGDKNVVLVFYRGFW